MLRRGNDEPPPQSMQMPPQMQMQMPDGGSMGNGNMMAESQLVEDILKEMGDSPGIEHQSNINSQAFHFLLLDVAYLVVVRIW